MIGNLPLAITVSLHRLLEDVSWGSHLHMSRKLLPGNEQLNVNRRGRLAKIERKAGRKFTKPEDLQGEYR